ncbi:FA8 factor, partial [Polypterus senegalus]
MYIGLDEMAFIGENWRSVVMSPSSQCHVCHSRRDSLPAYPDDCEDGYRSILGPTIKAEVNDKVIVNFKNFASRPYSVNPIGITYWKQSEGAGYNDETSKSEKGDDEVAPGDMYTYTWEIQPETGPMLSDPQCLTYSYSSHVNPVKDFNSGLIGALLICKPGTLKSKDIQPAQDIVLLFSVFDESQTWYANSDQPTHTKQLHCINGYVNSTLPDLKVCLKSKDQWHLIGMGTGPEIHSVHFQDHTLLVQNHRRISFDMTPVTFASAQLNALKPGKFLVSCQLHQNAGMVAYFIVEACAVEMSNRKVNQDHEDEEYYYNYEDILEGLQEIQSPLQVRSSVKLQSKIWVHFIAVEEITWDYAPDLYNLKDRKLASLYLEKNSKRIGKQYKKAVYSEYTDGKFTTRIQKQEKDKGIMGPVLRGEVGDEIRVGINGYLYDNLHFKVCLGDIAFWHVMYIGAQNEFFSVYFSGNTFQLDNMYEVVLTLFPMSAETVYMEFEKMGEWIIGALDSNIRDRGMRAKYTVYNCDREDKNMITNPEEDDYYEVLDYIEQRWSPRGFNEKNRIAVIKLCKKMSTFNATSGPQNGTAKALNPNCKIKSTQIIEDKISKAVKSLEEPTDDGTVSSNLMSPTDIKEDLQSSSMKSQTALFSQEESATVGEKLNKPGTTEVPDITMIPTIPISRSLHSGANGIAGIPNHTISGETYEHKVEENREMRYQRSVDSQEKRRNINSGNMTLNLPQNIANSEKKYKNGSLKSKKNEWQKSFPEYKKVIFREYLDSEFTNMAIRGEMEEHLGILGPVIRAEINDFIVVIFRNLASRPYSFHLHGVYDKVQNSHIYEASKEASEAVQPNETQKYSWKVTKREGPTNKEFDCKTWAYYSNLNTEKDIHSGLIGPLLICKPGTLSTVFGRQLSIQEYSLFFMVFDENKSWYMDENISRNCPKQCQIKRNDEIYKTNNMFPGTFGTIEMTASKVGSWLIECRTGNHQLTGMRAKFLIYNPKCTEPLGMMSGVIQDEQITSSGHYGDWQPKLARLDFSGSINAWSGLDTKSWIQVNNPHEWFQVDFMEVKRITGIITQGAKEIFTYMFIKEFSISVSNDGVIWSDVQEDDGSKKKVFQGNQNTNESNLNIFDPPLFSRYIRIYPTSWNSGIALRVEFLGCDTQQ